MRRPAPPVLVVSASQPSEHGVDDSHVAVGEVARTGPSSVSCDRNERSDPAAFELLVALWQRTATTTALMGDGVSSICAARNNHRFGGSRSRSCNGHGGLHPPDLPLR